MRPMLAALLLAFASPGLATEPAPEPSPAAGAGLVDIPVEEWTALTSGRTVAYSIGGAHWALERYQPGGDRVILQFYDGACLEGTWDYAPPHYCFHWEGEGTSCFRHARLGDEVLIIETRDGVETGALQVMTGVSDVPLSCAPEAVS
jgi:hypothetical protein